MSFLSQPITLQSLFGPKRVIGPIDAQVVPSENTNDTLTITKQPVQQGASITDHAFKEPTIFTMTALFQDQSLLGGLFSPLANSGLGELYQDLLDLQSSRAPFDVITPKRIYRNVLMATLAQTTDKATENTLSVTMTFQEVLIVNVTTAFIPRSRLRNPGSNGGTQNAGRKQSVLSSIFGGGR